VTDLKLLSSEFPLDFRHSTFVTECPFTEKIISSLGISTEDVNIGLSLAVTRMTVNFFPQPTAVIEKGASLVDGKPRIV
jgi:hypothetical protein